MKKVKEKTTTKRKYTRRQVVQHRFITEKVSNEASAAHSTTTPAGQADAAMYAEEEAPKRRLSD